MPATNPATPPESHEAKVRRLEARVKGLETGLESLLRARPDGLECSNFHHAPKDRHEGLDCPCDARWDAAVEAACDLLREDA